ncbi:MAG: TRAP transporter small permease [Burkholderiales bacterium]|jgi:TRAP-type C4-dicarboxylate transport system permease small subunit|nr:TRAP transporter small permease [Burkholderiales bacterium]
MRTLVLLARISAVLAGILLTFITIMTCASILGRELFGSAITGDFELSGAATGAAIAMFMPWCQAKRGNIIVDFFTANCSEKTNGFLDRVGAFLLALCFGALAWRTGLGGLSSYFSNSGTMILGFPEWIVFACMTPPFALTCLIALGQVVGGFNDNLGEAV